MPPLPTVLRDRLLSARNPDGGWPYYRGKTSRLEPTAWALLALQAAGEKVTAEALTAWPRKDGLFVDRSSDLVNLAFNGTAGVVLSALGGDSGSGRALGDALIASKGQKIGESTINRQDNALQGWSWTTGTFSWVEPTAWGLLALKRLRCRDETALQRIKDAERLMADRICEGGGWNHGNSNMLGVELSPYVTTSALGLLALGDRRSEAHVVATLGYLRDHRLDERSGMALSLTRVALGVFDQPAGDVDDALAATAAHTGFLDNLHLTAMALYALSAARGGYEAFRV